MGRFLTLLLPLLAGISAVTAQHGHDSPEEDAEIKSMRDKFQHYTGYNGPTEPYRQPPAPTVVPVAPTAACSYWLENIKHQGVAAFNPNTAFRVFRNVKDFGAKGDGVTDDTAAINAAIAADGTHGPGQGSSTNTPNLVYFPAGTYLISGSIVDYYYTQLIGNPNCMPTLKATANFNGFGLIDGDRYGANGLGFGGTLVFYRQVRNFIIDMTNIPGTSAATGIHWPTAQATSLSNLIFKMSSIAGTKHVGIFIEEGSGGWMNDLVFYGGMIGMNMGNQQFSMRNLTFYDSVTAINQFWNWGWTYKSLSINNCTTGLNMVGGGHNSQSVGAVVVLDSTFTNTPVGVAFASDGTSQPPAAGALVLENIQLNNVPIAVQGPGTTVALAGTTGSTTVAAWAEGHAYLPNGPQQIEGPISPNPRPGSLLTGTRFYERSKPQYANYPVSAFVSTRSSGAVGDGVADDTQALQRAINTAARSDRILFFDAGTYKVTDTLTVPAGSRMVGEAYSVIMGAGANFNDVNNPQPVVQIGGQEGGKGQVEWSDMIVSTQGPAIGAILIQWNLASPSYAPSGMWDVHERIGGFIGSQLTDANCPKTPAVQTPPAPINPACYGAYLGMHVTRKASGLYMENVWFWTADNYLDGGNNQITIYTGRGLLAEPRDGNMWLYGTAMEHFDMYQYQFQNTANIVMGQIQIEIPYYQPNPNATIPFPRNAALNDPIFPTTPYVDNGVNIPNANAWGLRVVNSQEILVYGAGLYEFFNNWSTTCSQPVNGEICQSRIFSVENSDVYLYDLHTIGTHNMITLDGVDIARYSDNVAGFTDEVAVFRSGGQSGYNAGAYRNGNGNGNGKGYGNGNGN